MTHGDAALDLTSVHARGAARGDAASVAWLVERLSPLLLAQAEYRLGQRLRAHCDPHDLVQDVWLRVLPQLGALQPQGGRLAPVVLRYLGVTLLHRVRDLMEKHVLGKPAVAGAGDDSGAVPPADATGVLSAVVRDERAHAVHQALAALEPRDREVLVLRGIEQRDNAEVAALLGIDRDAASMRYRRALDRLRDVLPQGLADELAS